MKYVLLLDRNSVPLTCELNHHLDCHDKAAFDVIKVFEAESIEEADRKADEILDETDFSYQLSLFD